MTINKLTITQMKLVSAAIDNLEAIYDFNLPDGKFEEQYGLSRETIQVEAVNLKNALDEEIANYTNSGLKNKID